MTWLEVRADDARMMLRSPLRFGSPLLILLLSSACGDDTTESTNPDPDPKLACGGATLDEVKVSAGGRVTIPLSAELAGLLTEVGSTSEVQAWIEDEEIVVRAGYAAAEATIKATCADGAIETTATVGAFSMEPLLSWTDEEGAPPGREYFAWWLGDDRAVYLYGGFVYQPVQFTPSTDSFRFDLETNTWSQLSSEGEPPPPGGRVARADDGSMFYFGGTGVDAGGALSTPPTLAKIETSATAATYTTLDSDGALGSYTGSFIQDAKRDRWLSVCGVDAETVGLHCKVHAYVPGEGFTELEVEGDEPKGRYGFHYAFDEASDRVIVFAGQTGAANTAIGGDTWALDLSPDGGETPRWVQLFEEVDGISKRRNGGWAYDPVGRRMFVWGGTPDGANSVPGLDVLSLDVGREQWTHVDLPNDIPSRTSGQGVYDPIGERILWGFGNDDAVYRDLYVLSLAAPE